MSAILTKTLLSRRLFDYYCKNPQRHCGAMSPWIFCNSSQIWSKLTKPLGHNGFPFDRLMTPTLKAAGSNPVGRTKMNDPT